MALKLSLLPLVMVSIAGSSVLAATPENAEQEYQEVRKIALRDAKVRGAYEEADRKLEEKILQIDPALADYVRHRSTAPEPGGFRGSKKAETHSKATPTPAPAPAASGTTYVVKKGDTLGGIASHYRVTVSALKAANHIVDEKKLAVGQELKIPGQ